MSVNTVSGGGGGGEAGGGGGDGVRDGGGAGGGGASGPANARLARVKAAALATGRTCRTSCCPRRSRRGCRGSEVSEGALHGGPFSGSAALKRSLLDGRSARAVCGGV